ncbi:MAG TPA: MFS transporter, partial [Spirochaetota bacterium]|nr:MFS transporter [Spirochaetota bacterium]
MQKKNKIALSRKIIYGSGELFNATSMVIILMFFLKFLTDVVHIRPALAGIALVAGKLWDAVSDPLIGIISDRTKSSLGRRRFFLLSFCLPGSVSFTLLWLFINNGNDLIKIIYYTFAYITFKTFFTLLNVPYQALGTEITVNYKERTSLIYFRMIFSITGSLI